MSTAGCAPTYPKEKFKESIARVCKNEYNIDVKVDTSGKTIAIYLPLQDLIDFTFAITKPASEKINNVILSVSRVALSSDANYDFYCIIAHDIRIPEIQIVIIKSVDDVKRFLLNDISRGEYSKRMLIDIRLNPQSQKEHAIKEVFEKMGLDRKWQDQVMNDFFRAEPAALGDIGYWNNRFYVKDITLPEFLAEEIASRVRLDSREDRHAMEAFFIKSSKGTYISKPSNKYFRFEILTEPKEPKDADLKEVSLKAMQFITKIASDVLHSYRFDDFEYIEIMNQADAKTLRIAKDKLELFRKKKMSFGDVINKL